MNRTALALALVLGLAPMAAVHASGQPWPANARNGFMKGCLSSCDKREKKQACLAMFNPVCKCSMEKIQQKFDYTQAKEIMASPDVNVIVKQCVNTYVQQKR